MFNPLFDIDFYKADHRRQYPAGTTKVYSNLTPRSDKLKCIPDDIWTGKVTFFGLQYFIKEYLQNQWDTQFFSQNLSYILDEYQDIMDNALGKDAIPLDHIIALHKLGYLPIEIKALPEGTNVPISIPVLTIENTHPDFFWLTNYLETVLSCYLWKPITSATIARHYRLYLDKMAKQTGNEDFVDFQGHDFSFRGMSSVMDAATSGAGHLLSFKGTDTIPAILLLKKYYEASGFIAGSVPATEHSVMCMGGKETEVETIDRLLDLYPTGIVSVVSDTWNLWDVLTKYAVQLKDKIMNRNGKIVFRPDCYDEETMIMTNTGWKFFKDLSSNDLVAQVDNTMQISYVKPNKIICQDYEGDMYHFTDKKNKVDLMVTPNHRTVWQYNDKLKIEQAQHVKVGYHYKNGIRTGMNPNLNHSLTPLERFKIAFQADGSFSSDYKNTINHGQITNLICYRFSFSKTRKINRLEQICNDGNFEYSIHEEPARPNQKTFYVWLPKTIEITKDFTWVSNIQDLCSQWSQQFIDELSHWDSSIKNENKIKFDSTNKSVINVVELICIAAGYGCLISQYQDNRKEHFSDVYTCHILKNPKIGGQAFNKQVIPYKGKVYCVQVPTGMILVKRNRATMVSGNSGDPVKIICGDKSLPQDNPAHWGCMQLLWKEFGGTINNKGYKELDSHIGLIYGDSITFDRAKQICEGLEQMGFATTNMVFGIGSYTYQYVTRDTFGFAVKSTYGEINGVGQEIFKNPITDNGVKKSAKGKVAVVNNNGLKLIDQVQSNIDEDLLRTVFKNGCLLNTTTLEEIRNRAQSNES